LHARQEVEYETYIMKRQIEARIAGDMASNIVLPAAIAYQNMLIDNIGGLSDLFGKDAEAMTAGQRDILATVSETVSSLYKSASALRQERGKINKIEDIAQRAVKYGSVVTPLIEEVGGHCARLEQTVDNEIWPLPKFQEMLFTR
jgi:glutamine synthetase